MILVSSTKITSSLLPSHYLRLRKIYIPFTSFGRGVHQPPLRYCAFPHVQNICPSSHFLSHYTPFPLYFHFHTVLSSTLFVFHCLQGKLELSLIRGTRMVAIDSVLGVLKNVPFFPSFKAKRHKTLMVSGLTLRFEKRLCPLYVTPIVVCRNVFFQVYSLLS